MGSNLAFVDHRNTAAAAAGGRSDAIVHEPRAPAQKLTELPARRSVTSPRVPAERARYEGNGSTSPPWWPSIYGAADRAGSSNENSPQRTLAALKLARTGEIVELGRVLDSNTPALPPRSFRQVILAHGALPSDPPSENAVCHLEESVTAPYQIGTHLDGLGHMGIAGRFYNGCSLEEIFDPTGLRDLGIEHSRPWICRGVHLDLVKLIGGGEPLPAGFVITPEQLEQACTAQGVEIAAGDAIVIHTGWGEYWSDSDSFTAGEPGVGWDAAHWLTERRVSIVGADTWGFEPVPFETPERPWLVHQHLLAETGTHVLENLRTEALAEIGCTEFLFMLAVPKARGATAAAAAPIAVI
jgi:kynurenine formamidase